MKSSRAPDASLSASPTSSPSSSPMPFSATPETYKKSRERWDSIASQFNLPLSSELTALPPVDFPSFPTVKELATSSETGSPSRPAGLYEELLQSRPEAIYVDVLDHPEKYEDGVKELASELVARRRELTDRERELMNRAVLDFVARPKDRPPAPRPAARASAPAARDDRELELDPPTTEGNDPPPFWWL